MKQIPIIGFCAYSGTGKTTLLKQLIPYLKERGYTLAVIKHAHHEFDVDQAGKDSYELRKAGAQQMLISSSRRYALMHEHLEGHEEPRLNELISRLDQTSVNLILVEGFKHEPFPKIELHRTILKKPFFYKGNDDIIALASDGSLPSNISIPFLDLNQIGAIGDFIEQYIANH